MSYDTVRAALASFLTAANIPGVAKVYQSEPWYSPGETLDLAALGGSGAFVWIEMGEADEERWAVPASYPGYTGSGIKAVHYPVSLIVEYQYLIPQQTFPPVAPDGWVTSEGAILQALKDRIHSDPTLGAPTVVFQAAQEPGALKTSPDAPVFEPGKVLSTREITFRITEVVQA